MEMDPEIVDPNMVSIAYRPTLLMVHILTHKERRLPQPSPHQTSPPRPLRRLVGQARTTELWRARPRRQRYSGHLLDPPVHTRYTREGGGLAWSLCRSNARVLRGGVSAVPGQAVSTEDVWGWVGG